MEKIIFDCDNTMGLPMKEVDDGLTILYLLGQPNLELLGITTTFGNGTIEQVHPQTQKLMRHLNVDIPVLIGEGSCDQAPDTPAAMFLVDIVNDNPGEITLLATGPLGNLHAAAKLNPLFFHKVKRIAVMGGYLEPVILGRRNLAELNLSANPEASLNVLAAPCPVTIFPAQVCLEAPYRMKDIHHAKYWP
ncbi:MAG: nucleoside hydrolase, partial [Candidatus Helarchaeota archaeon]